MTKSELADAHARHYNKHSIGICYEGGKDPSGRNADTRTPEQKLALRTLLTCKKKYSELAIQRLESQGIPYLLQPAGQQNLNVYFGRRECLEAIRLIVTRPLNQLTRISSSALRHGEQENCRTTGTTG